MRNFVQKIDKYLFFIVVIASLLRFSNLTSTPPSLNWDEVSHGYNAYSILTSGKDEWGVTLPTIFRAYGDYKLPVYIYLTAIFEKFIGLNALAVRLPSALAGIGTVVFTYLFVLELLKNRNLARLTALLVAIEPWSLFLSRGGFEANLALLFIVSGAYFFLKGVKNSKYFIPTSILLGLSVWTYNSARVFTPILVIILLSTYWKELLSNFKARKISLIANLVILAFFFIPMFLQLLQPVGQARYGKVSIINDGSIAAINEARGISKLPPQINRLVNNRVVYFTWHFLVNWASHFSGNFLFFKGGSDYQFSVPGWGILYFTDMIPIVIGLLWLATHRSRESNILLAWFLFSPIPSALTNEAPQVLRAIVVLPIPMIITAIGMESIASWLKDRFSISRALTITIYILIVFACVESYLTNYFKDYREKYSWSWQYGYEQVVNFAKEHYADYDKIIVTKNYGEPHEFFLFYLAWNSNKFRNDPNLIRYYQSDWYWVDRFDKFYFVNDWQIPKDNGIFVLESKKETVNCDQTAIKCMLITTPGNHPKNWNKLNSVEFLDRTVAFEIYAN